MPRKLKRRTLDVIETLQSYEHRIRSLPPEDLEICTSERRMGQDFIAAIPFCGLRENVKILYVGQHNSFTGRRRNQTLSVLPIDKRYKEEENLLD